MIIPIFLNQYKHSHNFILKSDDSIKNHNEDKNTLTAIEQHIKEKPDKCNFCLFFWQKCHSYEVMLVRCY